MIPCIACPTPRRTFSSEESLAVHLIDEHGLEAPAAAERARLIAKDEAKTDRRRAKKTKAHPPSAVVAHEPEEESAMPQERTCKKCGLKGHMSNNTAFHPKAGTKDGGGGVSKPERAGGKKRKALTRRHPLPKRKGASLNGTGLSAEIAALGAVSAALEPLDVSGRANVLGCICKLLSIDTTTLAA